MVVLLKYTGCFWQKTEMLSVEYFVYQYYKGGFSIEVVLLQRTSQYFSTVWPILYCTGGLVWLSILY